MAELEFYDGTHSGQQIDDLLDKSLSVVGRGVNLLDNAYFIGGGSQQGGGQFPINQRGAASYTVDGYCIDRWVFDNDTSNSGSFTFDSDGVKIAQGSAAWGPTSIHQVIDNPSRLAGKTVTLSALVKTNVGYAQVLFYGNDSVLGSGAALTSGSFTLITKTITLPNPLSMLWCVVYGSIESGNGNYGIVKAIKLELGDTQTLAHQENGVWVLNDPPPNYQQELAKCQRYQLVLETNTNQVIGIADGDLILFPTPVSMRGSAVSFGASGSFRVVHANAIYETLASNQFLSTAYVTKNVVSAIVTTSDLNRKGFLDGYGASSIILDANL